MGKRVEVFACLLPILLAGAVSPRAEVLKATAEGFQIENRIVVQAAPEKVYQALTGSVAQWWNPSHTFFGEARHLSIEARAGGCFCERTPDGGSAVHGTVLLADPGKVLRMNAGLGPLQDYGVVGSLTFHLTAEDSATQLRLTYSVGGYHPDGLASWAAPVDGVLNEQLTRLKSFVETGSPVLLLGLSLFY